MTDGTNKIETWYPQFYAQTWYQNTFLVHLPSQIGQALGGDQEWNNLYDSGCNFTCLAMMVGVDPAYLASVISRLEKPFFDVDPGTPALCLTGQYSGLVWDNNGPGKGKPLDLPKVWIRGPEGQRACSVTIQLVSKKFTKDADKGRQFVKEARKKGYHIVCGPDDHSHLVAGTVASTVAGTTERGDYFVWDPNGDDEDWDIKDSLTGKVTFARLFEYYKERMIEFLIYKVHVTNL
jgi:hypothetical protein